MTNDEIFDFYDANWNDYNKVMDMLHNLIDEHGKEIKKLEKKLNEKNSNKENRDEIQELKNLLLECQDKLDEETHKVI